MSREDFRETPARTLEVCRRDRLSTSLGELLLWHDQRHLLLVCWEAHEMRSRAEFERHETRGLEVLRRPSSRLGVRDAFAAYFEGEIDALGQIGLVAGGTPFQRSVWKALLRIMPGGTSTYLQLARLIDRPSASRAVGAANGANPLPIAIGCHRILGSNGSLTGYGSGTERKKWLIEHERRHA